jgi:hypothetical protein
MLNFKPILSFAIFAFAPCTRIFKASLDKPGSFDNRGKNAPHCIAFQIEIFLLKIEISFGKNGRMTFWVGFKNFLSK